MASVIGQLRVLLGLDTAAFETGAKRAEARAKATGDKMEQLGQRVGKMSKLMIAAGGAVLGSALFSQLSSMVKQGLEYASSLGEQAKQLGVSTSALQQYRYMATQVGIEQETMDKGLSRLTVTLGELSAGAEGPRKMLERFGVTAEEVSKLSKMTAEQALPLLADKFNALKSATEQAAFAKGIFGAKLGPQFQTLLAEGSNGIDNLAKAYRALGIEVSDDLIRRADAAQDKISELNRVLEAKISIAVGENTQSIEALTNALITLVVEAGNAIKAFKRFKFEQGLFEAKLNKAAYLGTDGGKYAARERVFQDELDLLDGKKVVDPFTRARNLKALTNSERPASEAAVGRGTGGGAGVGWMAVLVGLPSPMELNRMAEQAERVGNAMTELMNSSFGIQRDAVGVFKTVTKRIDEVTEAQEGAITRTRDLKATTKDTAAAMRTHFSDAADGIIGAIDRIGGAFSGGGGFLGKLAAILELGKVLGGLGVFGKTVQGRIQLPQPRALGGPINAGGLYLVGERGPELFSSGRDGTIIPNHRLGSAFGTGAPQVVHNHFSGNLMTPEFWERISAGDRAAAASGSNGAQVAERVRQSRRFP